MFFSTSKRHKETNHCIESIPCTMSCKIIHACTCVHVQLSTEMFHNVGLKVLGHGHVFEVWILISSGSDIIIQIRTRGFGVLKPLQSDNG